MGDSPILFRSEGEIPVVYRRAGENYLLLEFGPPELDVTLRLRAQLVLERLKTEDHKWYYRPHARHPLLAGALQPRRYLSVRSAGNPARH